MKWLLIPITVYIAFLVLMYLGQRSLLYIPDRRTTSTAELDALGLQRWPSEVGYRGYLFDVPEAEATVVVFHGNAGSAIDRRYYVEALRFSGARVVLAEYPGYGARKGRPSQQALVGDARETLALLQETYSDEPLYVIGESLGAGVAAGAVGSDALAAPLPRVDALLLLTPWNSLTAVAGHHYPILPVTWLLRDRYPSARWLADLDMQKVVVVAEQDEVVPAEFGLALFDALPEPRALIVVDDARHNDWIGRVDQQWWRDLWATLTSESRVIR